jgi:heme exporter protein B
MSRPGEWTRVRAILWKDLVTEWRTRTSFNAAAFLAALIVLLFGFALGPDRVTAGAVSAGVVWMTLLFAGVLTFNRAWEREIENGALEALVLYPGDVRSIFVGKVLANVVFLLAVGALVIVVAGILYGLPVREAGPLLVVVFVLGIVGFVTLGTFYAAMASRLRAREVLLPLLLFPMLVPLLLAAVEATAALLTGDLLGNAPQWIRLLIVFDVVFAVATYFAFEFVIEE